MIPLVPQFYFWYRDFLLKVCSKSFQIFFQMISFCGGKSDAQKKNRGDGSAKFPNSKAFTQFFFSDEKFLSREVGGSEKNRGDGSAKFSNSKAFRQIFFDDLGVFRWNFRRPVFCLPAAPNWLDGIWPMRQSPPEPKPLTDSSTPPGYALLSRRSSTTILRLRGSPNLWMPLPGH